MTLEEKRAIAKAKIAALKASFNTQWESLRKTFQRERVLCLVDSLDGPNSCWNWLGALDRGGYGLITVAGHGKGAHRVVYEMFVGKIPKGLHLDHLCRNPMCCNPRHLEPVTPEENFRRGMSIPAQNARKTHCIHGHEFTPENTLRHSKKGRICKACCVKKKADKYARKTAERLETRKQLEGTPWERKHAATIKKT